MGDVADALANDTHWVDRTRHFGAIDWKFYPSQYKLAHSVGRTVNNLQPPVTQEDVDALVQIYGTTDVSSRSFSLSVQIDLIATEILRRDRQMNVDTAHSARKDYYSVHQWLYRVKREIPFPDIEALEEMRKHPKWRPRDYDDRVLDVPQDKSGDRGREWSRAPRRVES